MNIQTKPRMTVDEYLAWAAGRPGRYELFRGEVFAMSPETVGHIETKAAVHDALRAAIRARGLTCHVLPDGATVRVDDATAYEPDALVYCGQRLPPATIEIPDPIIVVEVLSPSTRNVDTTLKLAGYFRVRSVAHYLIIDPTQPVVIHHARGTEGSIMTRVVTEGAIDLDPPGLALSLSDIYDSAGRSG
jgi:Uma2 family endonuclease